MESRRLDEIAQTLDDIATTLEEIKDRSEANRKTLDKMYGSIEKAREAIDRLDNENDGDASTS